MQAIETKYLGPTNFKGARIKAQCAAKALTIGYNHALNLEDNHINAAYALIKSLQWDHLKPKALTSGVLKNGNYAHCLKV